MANETDGVTLLKGDPKTAIIKLSIPMMIAMLATSTYNLANAVWVAGLGSDALAAIGFATPLFMISMGLGNGIGAGASSCIARKIGAENKEGADNAAVHSVVAIIVLSIVMTILLFIFGKQILTLFGAGDTLGLTLDYAYPLFLGIILINITSVMYGILRAEGDTKRAMYAMIAASLLNIVLDPLFIYVAGMGIAGAAWGMNVSLLFVFVILLYWFYVKRDTYISLSPKCYSQDRSTYRDILNVGIPASLDFVLMSLLVIILNTMLVILAGTDAVAVYSTGWRVVMFAIIPLVGIAVSVVAVGGASYGARIYQKLRVIHTFSTGFGVAVSLITSIIVYMFASEIATAFSYSSEGAHLSVPIAMFLSVMCLSFPFVAPGMMSCSIFQGIGRGEIALILSILRNIVFIALFAYLLGFVFNMGEQGVWWGIVTGDILGGIVAYIWAHIAITRLINLGNRDKNLLK